MKALGKGSVASIVKVGLNIAWVILWLCAVGLVFAALAYVGLTMAALGGFLPADMINRSDGFVIVLDGEDRLDWRFIVPAFLAGAAMIVGALVIVWRLKRLFHNFTSGEPFSADNARHLRVIWITLLAVELSRIVILALFGVFIVAFGVPAASARTEFDPDLNLMNWAMILILIVLAEVFREGARLREEQELTI